MMVAILALVYRGLVKIVPSNVQMVFVPFLSRRVVDAGGARVLAQVGVLDREQRRHDRGADPGGDPELLGGGGGPFRAVFYFLPIMVAYNASKKLKIDPWVGTAIMAALLTPEYIFLSDKVLQKKGVIDCVHNATLDKDLCVAHVAGIPMQLNDYGGHSQSSLCPGAPYHSEKCPPA